MMPSFRVAVSFTVAVALGLLAGLPVAARTQEGFVLIANQANPISTLARGEASKLFLSKRSRWSTGQRALPVDQAESSPIRRRFSDIVHRMDVPSVKSFWQEVVFSGTGDPPLERASDEGVIAYVKANPAGLGYIGSDTPIAGVKIIILTP